jgi:hypothetical protein
MQATRFVLALALAASASLALAAPVAAAGPPDAAPAYRMPSGASVVAQQQVERQRLESQGFPQYND